MSLSIPPYKELTILLLGDEGIGKSMFLSRLSTLQNAPTKAALPQLCDSDQPFTFNLNAAGKSYSLEFYDTSSPTQYTLLKPCMLILCFSISNRKSLESLSTKWKSIVETCFDYGENLPIIVLGLQRDLRNEQDVNIVPGHEAIDVAQNMLCDRYCECSALTGELCHLVFEDISRTAVMTTTERGGRSEGPWCEIM